MFSGLLCERKIRVLRYGIAVGLLSLMIGLTGRQAHAEGSSALGGSLLEQGEVAITFGGGFPDALVQFDFANSKRVNLAMRARINYNFGFPFFGFNIFASAPLRINVMPISKSKLQVAVTLEPGAFIGGGALYGLHLGFLIGAGALVSYQINNKWNIYGGLELQFHIGFEPDAGSAFNPSGIIRPVVGFNLPIEAVFGAEYKLNESYSLFARIAIGPMIYAGNMGAVFNPTGTAVHGSGRLWVGAVWRR